MMMMPVSTRYTNCAIMVWFAPNANRISSTEPHQFKLITSRYLAYLKFWKTVGLILSSALVSGVVGYLIGRYGGL